MLHELITPAEIDASFQVMKELRTQLSLEAYLEKLADCQKRGDYQLFAWLEGGEMVACCGVMPMPTLYYTDCLWVAELIVSQSHRSQGIGGKLLEAIEGWAKANGYREIALSSGIQRLDAHRFYQEKAGYQLVSYQFQKSL